MGKPNLVHERGRDDGILREESFFNLPNAITVLRILLIPVFIWVFSSPTPGRALGAAIVFAGAAFTDFLDGYLARRSGQITNLGKLLDPVADKLLVATGLILLVQVQLVSVWLAIVMIAREMLVTGARVVAAKEGLVVPADSLGKIKVIGQIGGILLLLLQGVWLQTADVFYVLGSIFLYVALAFSLISGWKYLVHIFKKIGPHYW